MTESLSETELRKLSQNLGSLIPKNGSFLDLSTFQDLERILRQITYTVSSAQLSLTHATAAWNCLCALLELGISSSDSRLRELGFSSETWIEVFRIFLSRSPNTKAKSSKQVLFTLTKLLSKQPKATARQTLKEFVINSVVMMICEQGDYSSVKPAFQVLEHFLNKGLVESFDIVDQMARKGGFQLGLYHTDTSREGHQLLEPRSLSQIQSVSLIEAFTSNVLHWSKYPDIAPLAGRLLSSFFKTFRSCPTENNDRRLGCKLPLWITPIKEAVKRDPFILEICETHVLPSLLALSSTDTAAFLETLPIEDLRDGNSGSHSIFDIQLCLSALNICADSRRHMTFDTRAVGTREFDEYAPQYVAYGLLAHPSSTIRITALSLLTNSFSHTSPISVQTLTYLQHYIPCFHEEANPKVRGEFVSQILKYCDKLGRGFSILRKMHESTSIQAYMSKDEDGKIAADESVVTYRLLEKLHSFSDWYVGFLVAELQHTASYQRHITALKILEKMIQVAVNVSDPKKLFHPATIVDDDFNSNNKQFFGSRCVRLLLDLVMDPYDDVRLVASTILRIVFWNMHPWNLDFRVGFTSPFMDSSIYCLHVLPRRTYNTYILYAMREAEELMDLTGRADHADGVGRLYSLLHDSCKNLENPVTWSDSGWPIVDHILSALENDIKIARKNILLAVKTAPLHGKLIALRHIVGSEGFYDSSDSSDPDLRAHRTANSRILGCCKEIWEAVKVVLCFDSPEGFDSEEGEIDDLGIGTKDTLSFCWRALKESSSLMNLMVTTNPYSSSDSNRGFRYEDFQNLGNLTFLQLAELRHRGAFSAVSQTFSACCKRCAQAKQSVEQEIRDSLISHLPQEWYQDVLEIIQEKSSSLTRRSAGIPAIITGILSAFPSGDFFDDVVLDLQAIADTPLRVSEDFENIRLPQVHALNCLKDVFTDAFLGPASEPHVAITLEIAAGCLESNLWAIRNCGLMLFKALLRRLNGGTDTASTKASSYHRSLSKLAYEKYPNLPNMILRLLCQNHQTLVKAPHDETLSLSSSLQAQRVFPALEILQRSGLPLQHRVEIEEALRHHMESPVWAIREKAAKALALVISQKDLGGEIRTLLQPSKISQNCLHGRLLCVRFMISRIGTKPTDERDALLVLILDSFEDFVTQNACPITAAVYLNIATDGLGLLIQTKSHAAKKYALRLKGLLPSTSRVDSVSSDESLPGRSSALLAEALKQSWILINIADDSSPREPSGLPLKSPVTPPRRNINEDSFAEQDSETKRESAALLENIDVMALKGPTRERDSEINPRIVTRRDLSFGVTDLSANSSCPESSLLSTDLSAPSEAGQWASQGSPQESDDQLRSAGTALAIAYKNNCGELKARGSLASWICKLSLAGEEHSDVTTRIAAAESMTGFITKLRDVDFDGWAAPELLGGYLFLYDALSDDDEEVRDQGAIAASTFLSAAASKPSTPNGGAGVSLMPSAASSRLLQYLVAEYKDSPLLWIDALRRVAGASSLFKLGPVPIPAHAAPTPIQIALLQPLRSVRAALRDARRPDPALFVAENPNLFLDPVRDAQRWAHALTHLDPPQELPLDRAWCIDGLTALLEIAHGRADGPLGWTANPPVFTLGMRIILLATVRIRVFHAPEHRRGGGGVGGGGGERERGGGGGGGGEGGGCEEERLVRELLRVGKESFLHPLWLRQMEHIVGVGAGGGGGVILDV